MEALNHVVEELKKAKPFLPLYLHLIVSAVFPIVIAAHASLRRPVSAAPLKKTKKTRKPAGDASDSEEESTSPIETLTTSDAILFPILAGVTLTGLYVLIKWLEDPAILNKILGYYFNWIGTFFTFKFAKDVLNLLRSSVFPAQFSHKGVIYKYNQRDNCFDTEGDEAQSQVSTAGFFGRPVQGLKKLQAFRGFLYYKVSCTAAMRKPLPPSKTSFSLTALDGIATFASAAISLLPSLTGKTPWYVTNLQGFSFCYGSLQFMSPGTAGVGSLLLSLLFFYDIYMVFYTPMMVTVATKLEVPIKLLFPRPDDGSCPKPIGALPGSEEMEEYLKCLAKKRTMAMLGLGDIVVPGIMIAYALRFDLYRYYWKLAEGRTVTKVSPGDGSEKDEKEKNKESRPVYLPVRGMWAERFYTTRKLWSPALKAKNFPKPYFKAAMTGYVLGLVATLFIMQVYNHAQPALLYLVPGVLSSIWGMAVWKREVKLLWNHDEAAEEKEAEKKQEQAKKKKAIREKKPGKSKDVKEQQDVTTEKRKVSGSTETKSENGDQELRPAFSFNVYLPPSADKGLSKNKVSTKSTTKPDETNTSKSSSKPDLDTDTPETSVTPLSSSASSTPELVAKEEGLDDSNSVGGLDDGTEEQKV